MGQCTGPAIPNDAAVVEDALKLGVGLASLPGCEIGLSALIGRVEAGHAEDESDLTQLDGRSLLQRTKSDVRVFSIERQLCVNGGQPQRLHLRIERKALFE